jgi:hypothetical protein
VVITATPAHAATFIVNSSQDAVDAVPGDGVCETVPGNGVCTLRAAVMEANRTTVPSTIDLGAVPGGIATLTLPAAGSDDETTGDLNIRADMIVLGAGASATTIDANGTVTHDRAFRVEGARMAILGVTIRGGRAFDEAIGLASGGAVSIVGGALILNRCAVRDSSAGLFGGGLYVRSGTVLVTGSTFTGNTANSGGAIAKSGGALTVDQTTIDGNLARFGGGVYDNGPLDSVMFVVNSTIAHNRAHGSPPAEPGGFGGGLDLIGAGAVTFQNATISGNVAENAGGGINNQSTDPGGAPVRIFSSTIAANSAVSSKFTGGGNNLYVRNAGSSDRITLENTILENCYGTVVSNGHNLTLESAACTVIGPIIAVDPRVGLRLGPLQDNGGATATHALLTADPAALLPQSAAIDTGDPQGCHDANGAVLTVDQRGVERPFGATCDIGAYELNVCIYAITQGEVFAGVDGAAKSLPLTVNDTRCSWTAASSVPWMVITAGSSGAGSGTISYTVLPNPGGARRGVLTTGGQTLLVRQASHEGLRGDFDGDRQTEVAIYRPSNGMWFMLGSRRGFTEGAGYAWGTDEDVPVPGDYDGDGRGDITVYRPATGHWFVLKSSAGFTDWATYQWGTVGDIPVPGDYDGDAATDIAIYRPSDGRWYILRSAAQFTQGAVYALGNAGELPLPGDYDGDGRMDLAVYDAGAQYYTWRFLLSSSNYSAEEGLQWGQNGDIPVPGDYDGDGMTDAAVYDPDTGTWFSPRFTPNATGPTWGAPGDVPVPADYDGDGRTDVAVYRPSTGHWFVLKSGTSFTAWYTFQWGTVGDVPLTK